MQAASKKQHIAFEGYCFLPEVQDKQWYWIEKGQQQGPYGIADLFKMSQGEGVLSQRFFDSCPYCSDTVRVSFELSVS